MAEAAKSSYLCSPNQTVAHVLSEFPKYAEFRCQIVWQGESSRFWDQFYFMAQEDSPGKKQWYLRRSEVLMTAEYTVLLHIKNIYIYM